MKKTKEETAVRPLWILLAGGFVLAVMILYVLRLVAIGEGSRLLPIYSVETEEKKVALTFNCAWSAENIPALLETLSDHNAKATFFIVGQWAEENPSAVKAIADAGHEIGSHSNTHPDMVKLSKEKIREELSRSKERIEKAGGGEIKLFRAPSGSYSNELIETAEEEGYTTIQWDMDSRDWQDKTAEEIIEAMTTGVGKGSILLFHVGKENTEEALPYILETLEQQGYEFVSVSELIYRENYTLDVAGRQHLLKK